MRSLLIYDIAQCYFSLITRGKNITVCYDSPLHLSLLFPKTNAARRSLLVVGHVERDCQRNAVYFHFRLRTLLKFDGQSSRWWNDPWRVGRLLPLQICIATPKSLVRDVQG
jgi:hypothetical protein